MFFFKNHAETEEARLVLGLFLFFKKLYMRYKHVVWRLILIYFDGPQLGI